MSQKTIRSSLDSLLSIHNWEKKENRYIYCGELEMSFPEEENNYRVFLSPSSLISLKGCKKKLYLNKFGSKNTNKRKNKINTQDKENSLLIKGNIIHSALYYTVFCINNYYEKIKLIGWRTLLAPIIYHSIDNHFGDISSRDFSILTELNVTPKDLEKKITKIAKKIWLKRLGGLEERSKKLISQINKLNLDAENIIEKEEIGGKYDLLYHSSNEAKVVEYKTSTKYLSAINESYSDDEIKQILSSKDHILHPIFKQIVCYGWIINSSKMSLTGIIIIINNNKINVSELNIGQKSLQMMENIIDTSKDFIKEVKSIESVPSGEYSKYRCSACQYKLNCKKFLSESLKISSNKSSADKKPVLLKVKKIYPDRSIVELKTNKDNIKVEIKKKMEAYLNMMSDRIKSGQELYAYLELIGIKDHLSTEEISFHRVKEIDAR